MMKAIFNNEIVAVWPISKNEPIEETWVQESFDKKVLFWRDNLIKSKLKMKKLLKKIKKEEFESHKCCSELVSIF